MKTRLVYDRCWDEWRVEVVNDFGRVLPQRTYYTDNKVDAKLTQIEMDKEIKNGPSHRSV